MREYSKILSQFWIGATGKLIKKCGRDCQVVALYLLSSPHANMIGLYHLPLDYVTADTGIPSEGASEALTKLQSAGFCGYDKEAEVVWVFEMAKYQIAEALKPGDKQCAGVQNVYDGLPQNRFLPDFFDKYVGAYHMKTRREHEAPSKPLYKPLRSQEQEQEQEQEQKEVRRPREPRPPRASRETTESYTPEFDLSWAVYPKRNGDNPKLRAYGAWKARVKGGHTPEVIHAGVLRYRAWCEAGGIVGTGFVKQAATFFGRDVPFLDAWEIKPKTPPGQQPQSFEGKQYTSTPLEDIPWMQPK